MPPLHRAIALYKMQNVAVAVAQNLHLDVPRAPHVFFEEHRVVAKRGLGFAARLFQLAREIGGLFHHAHPAPAAAERRFDD